MYILKNAARNIFRMARRNVLIAIIVLAIAVSACLGLSARRAAEKAGEEALADMSVTATISFDRQSMMGNMGGGRGPQGGNMQGGSFDKDSFFSSMQNISSLTLDDYKKYGAASSVSDFYYTLTVYMNGRDELEPVSSESSEEDGEEGGTLDGTITEDSNMPNDFPMGGMMPSGMMQMSGDFTIVGYSSDSAMTDFLSGGNSSISEGQVFTEGEAAYECIISSELAIFNDISVGDVIKVTNPKNSEESYQLTVAGIYTSSASNENSFSMMFSSAFADPANAVYTSYATLKAICDSSEEANIKVTDENTGRETDSKLEGTLSATYCFADADSYYEFEKEVRTLGLDESYTVSSSDITAFENSMLPLNALSKTAGTFLIVILAIGGVVLVVLNIFIIRERKYEIGVLAAMGMKKGKIAIQFVSEVFAITLVAVIIGAALGAVISVPVTNALLENQIQAQQNTEDRNEQNFGRQPGGNMQFGDMPSSFGGGNNMSAPPSMPDKGGMSGFAGAIFGEDSAITNYVTEIDSATDFKVVLQMLGIAVLLTVVSGAASMFFVMRYDPLKILSNRD